MPTLLPRQLSSHTLSAFDTIALPDGTVWSHAAVMGDYDHPSSGKFSITPEVLREFVRNFETGYPSKVPCDYDHGCANGSNDGTQPIRKAGDVVEMRAVISDGDMTPEIKAVVDKYLARRKELGIKSKEPTHLGLWVRWLPTARGLSLAQSREYTEMSIAFVDSLVDNGGKAQGATVLSVALTNTPFLDDMIPIAASRGTGGSAADSAQRDSEKMQNRILLALSVLAGKTIITDDDAVTEIETLRAKVNEVNQLSSFRAGVAAEFNGEQSVEKLVGKIRELKTAAASAEVAATAAKKDAAKASATAFVQKYENRLTVPEKEHYIEQMSAEIESGVEAKDSKIAKILGGLKTLSVLGGQKSSTDDGKGIDDETLVAAKAKELIETDVEIKELAKTNPNAAQLKALTKARASVVSSKTADK